MGASGGAFSGDIAPLAPRVTVALRAGSFAPPKSSPPSRCTSRRTESTCPSRPRSCTDVCRGRVPCLGDREVPAGYPNTGGPQPVQAQRYSVWRRGRGPPPAPGCRTGYLPNKPGRHLRGEVSGAVLRISGVPVEDTRGLPRVGPDIGGAPRVELQLRQAGRWGWKKISTGQRSGRSTRPRTIAKVKEEDRTGLQLR